MSRVMFSLPESLVSRMKTTISSGERSQVIVRLLEREIESREQKLAKLAHSLENCASLQEEAIIWDREFGQDGLEHV